MQKQHDRFDRVVGLKSTDRVLLVGVDTAFVPWLRKMANEVESVKTPAQLRSLVFNGELFDKVIFAEAPSPDAVVFAAQLMSQDGLTCFLSEQDELRGAYESEVVRNYPRADVWSLKSDRGPLVLTNARGNPEV